VHLGHRVIAVDPVPERRAMAERHGVETIDPSGLDAPAAILDLTAGGAHGVVDAVGMEAHGSAGASIAKVAQSATGLLPDGIAQKVTEKVGVDRLTALHNAMASVRRGGTVSIAGVYGGAVDPMPMMELFDRQVTLRMGQANVKRWIGDLLPLVEDSADPLGALDLTTHQMPLAEAAKGYEMFQTKSNGCIKVVLKP
jgi:threonine dehydrogenase-like Zn-dependent dehydrogenase